MKTIASSHETPSADGPRPDLPLKGLRVIEFCQIAAGPFCGMLLADFGAEVIKIEPPSGDGLRQWPPLTGGFSENFASLNRGKQSVVLNLKNPEDLELARTLVLDADVLVENNRPGVMDRLGLGWSWFSARKPTLVYCSISAFGQTGPRSGEGGFDLTVQAAAGIMSVTGETGANPVKCGVPVSDFTAGLYAAYSISALVAQVRAGGEGAHLDVPMFSTTLAIAALQTSEYFGTGRNPARLGSAHPRNSPYQAYQASDGWFVIAAGNDRLWHSVCQVVERPDLLEEPMFSSPSLRAVNQAALTGILSARFAGDSVEAWLSKFEQAGVPSSAINGYAEALGDRQAEHLGLVRPMVLPNEIVTSTVGCPVRVNGRLVDVRSQVPVLGEHTEALREASRSGPDERLSGIGGGNL